MSRAIRLVLRTTSARLRGSPHSSQLINPAGTHARFASEHMRRHSATWVLDSGLTDRAGLNPSMTRPGGTVTLSAPTAEAKTVSSLVSIIAIGGTRSLPLLVVFPGSLPRPVLCPVRYGSEYRGRS